MGWTLSKRFKKKRKAEIKGGKIYLEKEGRNTKKKKKRERETHN